MIELTNIQNPLAVDTWAYKNKNGNIVSCKIVVGHPTSLPDDPNGDWMCPVSIENFTNRIVPAYGVGPVDSLMNAMTLVKTFFDQNRDRFTEVGKKEK